MEPMDQNSKAGDPRPACFGDEAKFLTYLEDSDAAAECARCSSEGDCGEYILYKCSRELIF